jgi:SAM-dependent methyltransferase
MMGHSERFTGRVAEYAQYRERYDPDIVLPLLREWCGLSPQWCVADVGAGTGMAGDLFRANGNSVVAVEPNYEMRSACASLHAGDPLFTIISGAAEATGLPDSSVEMIAVGRALHWFDVEAAFHEFQRILKPQGWIAILACGRVEDGREENLSFKEFLAASTGRDTQLDPLLEVYRQLETTFAGGRFHHAEVPGEMQLDWQELRGLTLSLSHAPLPSSIAFPAFEAELRGYFERYQHNGQVTMTTRTWVNAAQFAE